MRTTVGMLARAPDQWVKPFLSTTTGDVAVEQSVKLYCAMVALDALGRHPLGRTELMTLIDSMGGTERDLEVLVQAGLASGALAENAAPPNVWRLTRRGRHLLDKCRDRIHQATIGVGGRMTPRWDREQRVLRCGPLVLKRFRKTAPNQELILSSFEELGWPRRIDDPIPPHPEIMPSARLHGTIKDLNRGMAVRVIRFCGDGSGMGVLWRRVK